jgi:ATP-dependent helicase HrpB
MRFDNPLPIDEALPRLTDALARGATAVLVAPPGAGKTTRVPLALLGAPWRGDGRILVLEPRRIAARAAADRMAATLGERTGETVGLRVRFGSKVSARTRVEVVTEGIFVRLVLDDPELSGIAAVLFDEFHERSLDADLGLALALDVQRGLRPDLKLLVMSATLDGARIAAHLNGAPVIESEGRAFPVETVYLGRDLREPVERQMAAAITRAIRAQAGSVLAFLPGAGEIRRTARLLAEAPPDPGVDIVELYGAMDPAAQDRAIRPAPAGRRKVVLATSIAETSLTIEGVRVVVDSGLARVPRHEPDVGLTRLETVRVSRAAADQRRGRAGRTEPGICYRLWDEPQTASLASFATPEILSADLTSLVLDLAAWGVSDPSTLIWLDPPPGVALSEARALLKDLTALDADGRITDEGRRLQQLPLHPRLARMVVDAAATGQQDEAAQIAALVSEQGLGGSDVDLVHRLDAWKRDRSDRATEARRMAQGWARLVDLSESSPPGRGERPGPKAPGEGGEADPLSAGGLLALAFPDRVAKNRGDGAGAFLLTNGRGAAVEPHLALARETFIVAADITGAAKAGRIRLAAALAPGEIEPLFGDRIEAGDRLTFDPASASLRMRRQRRLGALVLAEETRPVPATPNAARLLAEGVAGLGIERLPWTKTQLQRRGRVAFLRACGGADWPDLSDAVLTDKVADWLAPHLTGRTSLASVSADDLSAALDALLPWPLPRRLEAEAPTHFEAPTGSRVPVDYEAEAGPTISIRVQELYGLSAHPTIAGGRIPLVLELLSPAHRPIQITRDLPGFWRGSWSAVKAEMKGRYPRHVWPDDPAGAAPTTRAKPRGT